ncbi:hypothetical protein BH09SUM1_BH09SUM1_11870 [soil metagenome]
MAKTTVKHKTAAILGADCPAGRAIALQLVREGCHVVLVGYDEQKLTLLSELIQNKAGDSLQAVLPRDGDADIAALLRPSRDQQGHFHFIINAVAAAEGPSDDPGAPARAARAAIAGVLALVEGKGNVRFITLWPDFAGAAPDMPKEQWHSLIRVDKIQMESEHTNDDAQMVRAAAAADTIIHLLQSSPGACPFEVRIEPRVV